MNKWELIAEIEKCNEPSTLWEIACKCKQQLHKLDETAFKSVNVGDKVVSTRGTNGNGYGVVLKKWKGAKALDVQWFHADGTPKDWLGLPNSTFVDRHSKARNFRKKE